MSSAKIGKRVAKTDENPHGWEYVDNVPYNEPCVVYIGGDGATKGRAANGYAKTIENEILAPMETKIPVYSVEYDFDGHNKSFARRLDFLKHRTALFDNQRDMKIPEKATTDDINPAYVDELFEKLLLPRISLSKGKGRLSAEEAGRRIRMLNIVAHCHGGFVALKLEDKMQKAMAELGYDAKERKQIQSQLLVVAHAPACALGVSKSQFVSFCSVYDGQVPSGNSSVETIIDSKKREESRRFSAEEEKDAAGIAANNWFEFKPCFFANKKQFLIKQKYEWDKELGPALINENEHNNVSYNDETQTKEGKMLQYFSKAVLQNGIKSSLENTESFSPLPPLKELIVSADDQRRDKVLQTFEQMTENGKAFRQKICQKLIESRSAITAKNLATRREFLSSRQ